MSQLPCPTAQLEQDMNFYTFGDYDFELNYSLTERYYKQLCIDFSERTIPGINEFQCSNQDKIGSLPELTVGSKKRYCAYGNLIRIPEKLFLLNQHHLS